MTARSTPYVVCDYETAPTCWNRAPQRHPATIGQQGAKYDAIRAALRAQGWTRPTVGTDRCPACGHTDVAALRAGEGVHGV